MVDRFLKIAMMIMIMTSFNYEDLWNRLSEEMIEDGGLLGVGLVVGRVKINNNK